MSVDLIKHALVFIAYLILGLIAYEFLPIEDDGSEYLMSIISGEYESLSIAEIGLRENAPLAVYIWVKLNALSSSFGIPFIVSGLALNVCCVISGCFLWKNIMGLVSNRLGIIEPSHPLFFLLFYFSGPIILISCNLYRDAFVFLLVSVHVYICSRFLLNRFNIFWLLLFSLLLIFATLFLRQAQAALLIIITIASIGIKYFSLRIILMGITIGVIGFLSLRSSLMEVGIFREIILASQNLNKELNNGGLSSIIGALPLLIKVFVLPVYFFSMPIPFGHIFEKFRWTDLILIYSSFTNFFLLIFFITSLMSKRFYKNYFAKRICIIFIMLPMMSIILTSFQMRHFTPYLPMMMLFVVMLNTRNSVSKLMWNPRKIGIFILFIFAHICLSFRMIL